MTTSNQRKKRTPALISGEGKIPPQKIDVEEAVLGAILLEANHLDKLISEITTELFYEPKNQLIASCLLEMYKRNQPIDLLTVTQQLKREGNLESAGNVIYLSSLTQRLSSVAHSEYYLRLLQETSLLRSLIGTASMALKKSFDDGTDVFDLYADVQKQLEDNVRNMIRHDVQSIGAIHAEKMKRSIENSKSGRKSGVPTGLTLLDNTTNGWQKSDFIIIAARPSMGKTALAVSCCVFPAIEQKMPCAIFSLEMSKEQLVSRIESSFSGVPASKIVKDQLTDSDRERIANSCKKFYDAPLFIDDTASISLLDLKAKARKLKKEQDIQMIIIDYLQLMKSGNKHGTREQEISEISRGLKAIAKELDIPVIALSQLSRSVETRGGDKKPILADLRESGQIEQDADLVAFCYRPEYYNFLDDYNLDGKFFPAHNLFLLIVAKHRNGSLGEIPLEFDPHRIEVKNHFQTNHIVNSVNNDTFVKDDFKSIDFGEKESSGLKPNSSFDTPKVVETFDLDDTNDPPF